MAHIEGPFALFVRSFVSTFSQAIMPTLTQVEFHPRLLQDMTAYVKGPGGDWEEVKIDQNGAPIFDIPNDHQAAFHLGGENPVRWTISDRRGPPHAGATIHRDNDFAMAVRRRRDTYRWFIGRGTTKPLMTVKFKGREQEVEE